MLNWSHQACFLHHLLENNSRIKKFKNCMSSNFLSCIFRLRWIYCLDCHWNFYILPSRRLPLPLLKYLFDLPNVRNTRRYGRHKRFQRLQIQVCNSSSAQDHPILWDLIDAYLGAGSFCGDQVVVSLNVFIILYITWRVKCESHSKCESWKCSRQSF